MRIAIVDDISEERTLLRNRLESQFSRRNVHVDIFEYENGETFLTAAKECPFTVVFLDIYMNGSNGIICCNIIPLHYSVLLPGRIFCVILKISHSVRNDSN